MYMYCNYIYYIYYNFFLIYNENNLCMYKPKVKNIFTFMLLVYYIAWYQDRLFSRSGKPVLFERGWCSKQEEQVTL